MYWYTIDDLELGPLLKPTLKLVLDESTGIKDGDQVGMCLAYRSRDVKDINGDVVPVKDTWEAVSFYTK